MKIWGSIYPKIQSYTLEIWASVSRAIKENREGRGKVVWTSND